MCPPSPPDKVQFQLLYQRQPHLQYSFQEELLQLEESQKKIVLEQSISCLHLNLKHSALPIADFAEPATAAIAALVMSPGSGDW